MDESEIPGVPSRPSPRVLEGADCVAVTAELEERDGAWFAAKRTRAEWAKVFGLTTYERIRAAEAIVRDLAAQPSLYVPDEDMLSHRCAWCDTFEDHGHTGDCILRRARVWVSENPEAGDASPPP